jgi:hypothetical protein
MPRSILISALVLLIAGCSIGRTSSVRPSPATTTSPASTASLACQDAIASEDSPDSYLSVVFNQVALPTSNALQANRSSEQDPSARLFAKIGLFIASGASFELIVPAEWVGRLMIGWGNPGIRATHLHVSGCVANATRSDGLSMPAATGSAPRPAYHSLSRPGVANSWSRSGSVWRAQVKARHRRGRDRTAQARRQLPTLRWWT